MTYRKKNNAWSDLAETLNCETRKTFEFSLLFDISKITVSNIFCTWINFMYQMMSTLDVGPSREVVNFYMPDGFKKLYPSTRIIVDCTEVPIENLKNRAKQQACFSNYKSRTTFKVEVGATPSGLLYHYSEAYAGSTSDRQIVERSSFIHKCEEGDSIMADRGFNTMLICKNYYQRYKKKKTKHCRSIKHFYLTAFVQ